MGKKIAFLFLGLGLFSAACGEGIAQTADQAWLRYGRIPGGCAAIPLKVRTLGGGALERSAAEETERSNHACWGSMPDTAMSARARAALGGETVLGTEVEMRKAFPQAAIPTGLKAEGYWTGLDREGSQQRLLIVGKDERGVLYGAFSVVGFPARWLDANPDRLQARSGPSMPVRWVDEWDNIDGSIERGYAGKSIFFEGGKVRDELKPVEEYARLLASVGINGCNLNNVNNATPFLEPAMLQGVARIADTMRPWGVRVALSVAIASPQKIGGLDTYDPLDPRVKAWWKQKVDEIYRLIPDFAGFTVKADSEGQPGPASYGRTPADAANLLAAALNPYGGVVLYRAFVYNHHLDWKDPKADRARAAYDIFHPLDGKFADNVIVQTKEGPIDFQAREPVSPLFGGLKKTSQAMEVQITQEYTGQQRHLVYLAPMWKQVLDFDMRAEEGHTPVKDILAGRSFGRPTGGMVGVAGVGREAWLDSPLALANLYAFGRLAWNPDLTPEEIAEEWTRQTVGTDEEVVRVLTRMLMQSWPAYEHYTGPLGMQTLTDITGTHYGPNIESSEKNGWGQWHRADPKGVGMDRTVATGTGFAGQYSEQVAQMYERAYTTPEDLLLFFHHVPYTFRLNQPGFGGRTVIQYIYDSHYAGAQEAAELGREWATLDGKVNPSLFSDVRSRLEYQAGHAIVWRDAVVQYFLKLSGIPDEKGRAGHFPGRLEAEDARLQGYEVVDVAPWEDASRGRAVTCAAAEAKAACSAEWTYNGTAGQFDVAVQYFDLQGGDAHFAVEVNGTSVGQWTANAQLPSRSLHGDNSTRYVAHNVELHSGDTIRVLGTPDKSDPAAFDYLEVLAQSR